MKMYCSHKSEDYSESDTSSDFEIALKERYKLTVAYHITNAIQGWENILQVCEKVTNT